MRMPSSGWRSSHCLSPERTAPPACSRHITPSQLPGQERRIWSMKNPWRWELLYSLPLFVCRCTLTHWPLGCAVVMSIWMSIFQTHIKDKYLRHLCDIPRWLMPQEFTDDLSTLVQVMAWCRQATSHYLNQCGPRSMSELNHELTYELTHWPLGDLVVISKVQSMNACYRWSSWALLEKLLSSKCSRKPLMIS